MAFTDEDLKRMKEEIVIGGVVWKVPTIKALLARLEAAERCIPVLIQAHKQICAELGYQYEDCGPLITWRKAAGR